MFKLEGLYYITNFVTNNALIGKNDIISQSYQTYDDNCFVVEKIIIAAKHFDMALL